MDEGKVAITSRRLFIMVIALIAPELMITWATRQFFSARDAAKDFNASAFSIQFTTTHSDGPVTLESTSPVFDIHLEAAEDFNDSDAFSAQSTTTHGGDRDISGSSAVLVSDVSEANRSSGAPKYAEFKRQRINNESSGDDPYMSESISTSLGDISEANVRSSAPRLAEIQEWRMTRRFSGADQHMSESIAPSLSDISEASGTSGSSTVPRPVLVEPGPVLVEFKGWTITHGFFAWMGGFMLHVNGKPRATLTPIELLEFVNKGSVDLPVITEAEIEDRSKGDGLSKGIAVLQLVWFVAQLVARYIQNLPITLLEIDTLAVTALTCISYALWWKKPKDVGCPCIVHLKATATLPGRLAYDNRDFLDDDSSSFNRSRPSESYLRMKRHILYPFVCLMGISATPSPRAARSRRAPSLGGYKDGLSGVLTGYRVGKIILLIGCFSGMAFGGIHCLGWNYFFHSHTEYILWCTTSLVVICAPVVILFDALAIMYGWGFWMIFGFIPGQIASFIYIAARVTLIILIILSLQSLPTGAYDTVAWTRFIPHL
ncbi:hypothetical protein DFJ58DRAFT_704894 [Suillus subalutaceus]|uniref:uncharacterized protein n=1 Tax=Suillus subalutaceus TaxID=48586 RepID=UPI001B87A8BF|nr:uncharacterized protein DFJ58DRAFT_704894 [Suillus subalutaceus]KAG1848949.1 hypothetical protein DFJ58DRAFT_704894 [Suillus subalutaceus]